MNIEQIIANAPEGAERYRIDFEGALFYYKKGGYFCPLGFKDGWSLGSIYWDEATPLPKPQYSSENPPPDGWEGDSRHSDSGWRKSFIHKGKLHLEGMGVDINYDHQFRETPTPREKFIERAQQDGADFGAIYDEFIGGEV